MFKKIIGVAIVFFGVVTATCGGSIYSDAADDHWARAAIDSLADRALITGDSGSFGGKRATTRFELAQLFVKTLAHLEQKFNSSELRLSADDLRQIQKINNEFAEELAFIGVRSGSLTDDLSQMQLELTQLRQTIDTHKASIDDSSEKIRLSGDILVRHSNKTHRNDFAVNPFTGRPAFGNSNNVYTESQIRFRARANIDKNISFSSRFRLLARGKDVVDAALSTRGSVFGLNGIGQNSTADMIVDTAFLEIKEAFNDSDRIIFGRGTWHAGHGLLLSEDIDAIRYLYAPGNAEWVLQYIYDRHQGSSKDNAATDFRGASHLGYQKKYNGKNYYLNLFAQDEPDLVNRRQGKVFVFGKLPGEQRSDRRVDAEIGGSVKTGKSQRVTLDFSLAASDYQAHINKPVAGSIIDINLQGFVGYLAATWKTDDCFTAKMAYLYGDDKFAGGYALNLDRRYAMGDETPFEDIARGNSWFAGGLINMSALKLQGEYTPAHSRHYFRVAANFLAENKDHVSNDLSHHLAGNSNGAIPAAFIKNNSAYDTFNNVGVADPKMLILNLEYCYQLATNTRIRIGYVNCDFAGDAVRQTATTAAVKAGNGRFNDYDYQLFWTEIYSKF